MSASTMRKLGNHELDISVGYRQYVDRDFMARTEKYDSEMLRKLRQYYSLWDDLAQNPCLDYETQEFLIIQERQEINVWIAQNPCLHPYFQNIIYEQGDFLTYLAENPSLIIELQHKLYHDHTHNDRIIVNLAGNPNIDISIQEMIVQIKNNNLAIYQLSGNTKKLSIQIELMKNDSAACSMAFSNHHIHEEVQNMLARHKIQSVRSNLAQNKKLHHSTQRMLMDDECELVVSCLRHNPHVSPKIKKEIKERERIAGLDYSI
jgi:hypothetical protein